MGNSITESSEKNSLKNSPLYNLSLSSLENFHTAFLVWLGTNYKKEFLNVLKELIMQNEKSTIEEEFNKIEYIFDYDLKPSDINIIAQSREGANSIIDIKITIFEGGNGAGKDEANIYIENKFKSYPTQEQIDKYREQIDIHNNKLTEKEQRENKTAKKRIINSTIILLTLAPTEEIKKCLKINYIQLCQKTKEVFCFSDCNFLLDKTYQIYNQYLINDYINMIDIISHTINEELNRKKEIKNKDMGMLTLDFYNVESDILKESEALKNVYVKYRGNEFAEYLRENINDEKIKRDIKSGFNNNKATIDINFLRYPEENSIVKEKDNDDQSIKIGIQIEGNQYRHYIIFPKTITSAEVQEELAQEIFKDNKLAKNLWFIGMTLLPKKPRKDSCYTRFNGYRKDKVPNFMYLYKKIENIFKKTDDKVSYKELFDKIEKDRVEFEENRNDIIKIIEKLKK